MRVPRPHQGRGRRPPLRPPSASLGCSQSRGNRGSLAGYRRRRRGRRSRRAACGSCRRRSSRASTAAVDSRSSQNATGRSRRAKRLRANWRTDWVRGPSPPARVSGRPTTSPPTLWVSINANSRAMSSRKRRRRIVSSGVAMMQRVSESAKPIVLVPTSRPINRAPAGTASRSAAGSARIMTDNTLFYASGRRLRRRSNHGVG